jgi:hypothetical protein
MIILNAARIFIVGSPTLSQAAGRQALAYFKLECVEGINSLFEYKLIRQTPGALKFIGGDASSFDVDIQAGFEFTCNTDSVGIELVGKPDKDGVYEKVMEAQNASLAWIVAELRKQFNVPLTEVFRHPQVSRKNETEAQSAKW